MYNSAVVHAFDDVERWPRQQQTEWTPVETAFLSLVISSVFYDVLENISFL